MCIGLVACMAVLVWEARAVAQDLVLAEHGKTAYHIEVSARAPRSVKLAGRELQEYLKKATGATLAIDHDGHVGPLISLGQTPEATAEGLSVDGIKPDGFRIVTRGENLFILGPDTGDGVVNATGGISTGTLNGVYAFLEDEVGVRWLMPGEKGEYVPKLTELQVATMDRSDAPTFARRDLPYVQNARPDVKQWLGRMRQGASLQIIHGHNWRRTIPPSMYQAHPDWFAEIGGKRVAPAGRYKLETTNPGLVAEYARRAIEAFKEDRHLYCYSLSPSDSQGWSQSPASKALYETDPHGHLSVTKMILQFYNAVAAIVSREAPHRILAGYIYSDYLYPPKEGIGKLAPNLFLVVAPSIDYGYCLYRPQVRNDWLAIMNAWAAHTKQLGYYDLPTNLIPSGVPQGPGIEILQFIYPKLARYGVKSIYMYGDTAWGGCAVGNYLKAKLAWNANADVEQLADDFYRHAYGQQAGRIMRHLYDQLDEATKRAYISDPSASYSMTPRVMKEVYAGIYPEMEKAYLEADTSAMDADQKWRLEMFGKSLALLRWDLTRLGLIKADPHSPLYRTNEQIVAMAGNPTDSLAVSELSFSAANAAPLDHPAKVSMVAAAVGAPAMQAFQLRGGTRLVLCAAKDEQVRVSFPAVQARGDVVSYLLRDSLGHDLKHGLIDSGTAVEFSAGGGQSYFLDITAQSASYQVQVAGCHYAVRSLNGGNGLHLLQQVTPLYLFVSGDKPFSVLLRSDVPSETAACTVVEPDGQAVASLQTIHRPTDEYTSGADAANGVWRVDFTKPAKGIVDDVWVKVGGSASVWFGLNPRQLLKVSGD